MVARFATDHFCVFAAMLVVLFAGLAQLVDWYSARRTADATPGEQPTDPDQSPAVHDPDGFDTAPEALDAGPMVTAFIEPLDNLARAVESAERSTDVPAAFVVGLQVVEKQFLDALQDLGIEPRCPLGEPFDPAMHNALFLLGQDGVPANTVVKVLARGYFNRATGRVVRHALVAVTPSPAGGRP